MNTKYTADENNAILITTKRIESNKSKSRFWWHFFACMHDDVNVNERLLYAIYGACTRTIIISSAAEKRSSNVQIIRDNPYITFKSDELLEYSWSIIIIATVKCTLTHSNTYPHSTHPYSIILDVRANFFSLALSLHIFFIHSVHFFLVSILFYCMLHIGFTFWFFFVRSFLFPLQINNFIDIFITFMHTHTRTTNEADSTAIFITSYARGRERNRGRARVEKYWFYNLGFSNHCKSFVCIYAKLTMRTLNK